MHQPGELHERTSTTSGPAPFRPVIFVVEDDEDIARLISHNLQAAGFEVQSFVSGASLLTEAVREMPALFLLDVMLPGTDGFELCRHIRQTPVLSSTPIIFLTASRGSNSEVTTTSPSLSARANWWPVFVACCADWARSRRRVRSCDWANWK